MNTVTREEYDALFVRFEALEKDVRCPKGEYVGNFSLDTEIDLKNLAGYKSIVGTLHIDRYRGITLEGLGCLERIGGDLLIIDTDLKSLDGLNNLKRVEGDLVIMANLFLCQDAAMSFGEQVQAGGSIIIRENGVCQ